MAESTFGCSLFDCRSAVALEDTAHERVKSFHADFDASNVLSQ
jgi:hypothetical protein